MISSTMLNRNGDKEHYCILFLILEVQHCLSQLTMLLAVVYLFIFIDTLYQAEEIPFYCQFDEKFHFHLKSGIDVRF